MYFFFHKTHQSHRETVGFISVFKDHFILQNQQKVKQNKAKK